jgi:hypothetical protein
LLNLSSSVDACFFGFIGRGGWAIFKLISLNFNGNLGRRLGVRILEEEMQIWLYFWIWSGFYIIG